MIDREHDLSITKQAEVLKISRGSVYYLPRRRCRCRARSPENITSPTLELRLPRRNLIGVNIEMLRQVSQRSIDIDGGERHLGLEYRCVVPALSSAHRSSCSRPSSPLSGRNSTYRPVQICESSSAFLDKQGLLPTSATNCSTHISCSIG